MSAKTSEEAILKQKKIDEIGNRRANELAKLQKEFDANIKKLDDESKAYKQIIINEDMLEMKPIEDEYRQLCNKTQEIYDLRINEAIKERDNILVPAKHEYDLKVKNYKEKCKNQDTEFFGKLMKDTEKLKRDMAIRAKEIKKKSTDDIMVIINS